MIKAEKLNKALIALEKIYLKPNQEDRSNIDATIRRFEFVFELFWKPLKEVFNHQGIQVHYPREVIKEAFSSNLIDNEEIWLQMLQDRNLTSHTYDEALADIVFSHIKLYVPIIKEAFNLVSKTIKAD